MTNPTWQTRECSLELCIYTTVLDFNILLVIFRSLAKRITTQGIYNFAELTMVLVEDFEGSDLRPGQTPSVRLLHEVTR